MRPKPLLIILGSLAVLGMIFTLTYSPQSLDQSLGSSPSPIPYSDGSPAFAVGGRVPTASSGNSYVFSDLVAQMKAGEVESLQIANPTITVKAIDGQTHRFDWPPAGDFIQALQFFGVTEEHLAAVRVEYVSPPPLWLFQCLVPLGMILLVLIFLNRMTKGSGGSGSGPGMFGGMGLKPSRAKQIDADQPKVTFDDVAGLVEAKEELKEVVEFLQHPEKFVTLGARIPKGVLLFGSPGCGKTLMARAVAGEAGVPFISIGGSEFVEVFVGVGASRVRELFDQAKKNAPCIVFVDEIDAVGGQRTPAIGGGQEHNQTLNQLLKEMDGFDQNTNVVVIAATNRPEMLDPALLRSGRFDRRVAVDRPDIIAREQIFEVHVRGKPLGDDVDLKKLAKATPGLTGADIENAVNEAAILAARFGKLAIGMAEFREGILKSVIGPERRSRTISKSEKRTIAYHEAGHAIAMHFTEGQDPIQKISVISRGFSLGFTMPVPEEDRNLLSKGHAFGEIVGLLGGRAAEELVFGKDLVTSGASNDLQRATDNARRMVTEWGMGEFVGLRSLVSPPGSTGMENLMRGERTVSEELSRQVDEEIKLILGKAYEQAYKTLVDHRDRLEAVVARLLEIETLEREEFLALVSNGS